MCEEGGRSADLGPFCVNSTGNSMEPMKMQDIARVHFVSKIIRAFIPHNRIGKIVQEVP